MRKRNGIQALSEDTHLPVRGGKSEPRLHQLRQLPLGDANHVPADHFGLLGERVQYGKCKFSGKMGHRIARIDFREIFAILPYLPSRLNILNCRSAANCKIIQ